MGVLVYLFVHISIKKCCTSNILAHTVQYFLSKIDIIVKVCVREM